MDTTLMRFVSTFLSTAIWDQIVRSMILKPPVVADSTDKSE
jgi:hypothetical protein